MFDSPLIRTVTLKDFIKEGTIIKMKGINSGLVFVGAQWCGHCKAMKPEIQKIAVIGGFRLPVLFVDGSKDSNKHLLNLLGIEGFPTIFIVKKKILTKYTGQRDHVSILHELCKSNDKMCFL